MRMKIILRRHPHKRTYSNFFLFQSFQNAKYFFRIGKFKLPPWPPLFKNRNSRLKPEKNLQEQGEMISVLKNGSIGERANGQPYTFQKNFATSGRFLMQDAGETSGHNGDRYFPPQVLPRPHKVLQKDGKCLCLPLAPKERLQGKPSRKAR